MEKGSFLSQVIDFIEKNGGRYIIAEDGKPEFVIMSVKEYQKLLHKKKNPLQKEEKKDIEKANYELALLKEEESLRGDPVPLDLELPSQARAQDSEKISGEEDLIPDTREENAEFTPSELKKFRNGKDEEVTEPKIEDLPF